MEIDAVINKLHNKNLLLEGLIAKEAMHTLGRIGDSVLITSKIINNFKGIQFYANPETGSVSMDQFFPFSNCQLNERYLMNNAILYCLLDFARNYFNKGTYLLN